MHQAFFTQDAQPGRLPLLLEYRAGLVDLSLHHRYHLCSMRPALGLFLLLTFVATVNPVVIEGIENVVHLGMEGHLAHAAEDGDDHEPASPEHGCTDLAHSCGCCASQVYSIASSPTPTRSEAVSPAPSEDGPSLPHGFLGSLERPPKA